MTVILVLVKIDYESRSGKRFGLEADESAAPAHTAFELESILDKLDSFLNSKLQPRGTTSSGSAPDDSAMTRIEFERM